MKKDIIIGIHSIIHACENPNRDLYEIIATEEGIDKIKKITPSFLKKIPDVPLTLVSSHKLQELAKIYCNDLDINYTRFPSGIFLLTNQIQAEGPHWILDQLDKERCLKILCLDGVTDVHNAAAILRTAAFYNADCVVVATKNNFGIGPNTSRIASGALEYVKIIKCSSLPKFLNSLKEKNISPIGFTEHTENTIQSIQKKPEETICLVLGSEEKGLSNATLRLLDRKVKFVAQGKIHSLNVSIASAIAMEHFFS